MKRLVHFCIVTIIAAALAACGRKGALEPPAGGYQLERGPLNKTAVTGRGEVEVKPAPVYDEEGKPIVPQGKRRKFFLDPLLD